MTATTKLNCGEAVFSNDPRAVAIRDAIDYSKKISLKVAKAGRNKRPIRVYGDGVYDMLHSGHLRQLAQAKAAFPRSVYLLVGVPTDEEVFSIKHGHTIMKQHERAEALRHCRYVDEIIMSAPFNVTREFLTEQKIDFVAHDDLPYPVDGNDDVYKWLKDDDMFLATQRTPNISSSDLVSRVLQLYRPPEPSLAWQCFDMLMTVFHYAWRSVLYLLTMPLQFAITKSEHHLD